jgi:methylated-DNA-protein-cysteine methyltransferase-like protein
MEQKNKPLSFFEQVYAVVAQIPYGRVISYGQIARMLGRPRAAREVGWALSGCPEELPWQRVVMADGSVTGGEHREIRRGRLLEEGVAFLANGRVDMEAHCWDGKPCETSGHCGLDPNSGHCGLDPQSIAADLPEEAQDVDAANLHEYLDEDIPPWLRDGIVDDQ